MTKDRPRNRPKSRGETGDSSHRPRAGPAGGHAGNGGEKPRRPDGARPPKSDFRAASDSRTDHEAGHGAPERQKPWGGKRPFQRPAQHGGSHGGQRYGQRQGQHSGSRHPAERRASFEENGEVWLWGLHTVAAALANGERRISKALLTRNAAQKFNLDLDNLPAFASLLEPSEIDRRLPADAVHQGAAVRAAPLDAGDIDDWLMRPERPLVILDQVTDPQNVGALFRSAAAFGFGGVVMQTRNAPVLGGALAKAAVGAIESVPEIRTVNISRAIAALTDAGWNVVGLAGEATESVADAFTDPRPLAIVMGAEGAGLRQGVASACTRLARIPMQPAMESLNVSNAAAIAFYEASRRR